jgi:DNA-binding MarR family transcriptional regulator
MGSSEGAAMDELDEGIDLMIARDLIEVVPRIMHRVRTAMRTMAKGQMTIAQMRILARLYQDVYTMTYLAEWQGVSPPAMSKMIDVLEKKQWVERVPHSHDRRQVGLKLTAEGKKVFLSLRKGAKARMAETLTSLPEAEKALLLQAFKVLSALYN